MKLGTTSFLRPIIEKKEVKTLETDLPEIAFIGRSNVGKSTLVNRVTGRKNLARTSARPGKTQEINLFRVELLEPEQQVTLADLPGFGFAKFSQRKRTYLSDLTVHYLENRPNLNVVCILNDVRRSAEEEELALQQLLFELRHHTIIVLTKCDKLNQSEKAKLPNARADEYHLESSDFFLSGIKTAPEQFWKRVVPLLEL